MNTEGPRVSDYENVREKLNKLYGTEQWMKDREERWKNDGIGKTDEQKELDRELFYALLDPEELTIFLYAYEDNNRRTLKTKFEKSSKKDEINSAAIKLLNDGATNDYIFRLNFSDKYFRQNLSIKDQRGLSYCWTPLDVAVALGLDETVHEILKKYKEEIHKTDENYHTPLYYGFMLQQDDIWKRLGKYGVKNILRSWILGFVAHISIHMVILVYRNKSRVVNI